MKCNGVYVILRGIFSVVSGFPLYISCYIVEIWITFLTVQYVTLDKKSHVKFIKEEGQGEDDSTVKNNFAPFCRFLTFYYQCSSFLDTFRHFPQPFTTFVFPLRLFFQPKTPVRNEKVAQLPKQILARKYVF